MVVRSPNNREVIQHAFIASMYATESVPCPSPCKTGCSERSLRSRHTCVELHISHSHSNNLRTAQYRQAIGQALTWEHASHCCGSCRVGASTAVSPAAMLNHRLSGYRGDTKRRVLPLWLPCSVTASHRLLRSDSSSEDTLSRRYWRGGPSRQP